MARVPAETAGGRGAAIVLGAIVAAMASLVLLAVLHLPFDSDEPQHLHVVWGWTHGMIQYRDVFDNHPPLFHLLMAPALAALGERADILVLMRLAALPAFAAMLGAAYALARTFLDRTSARWAAALLWAAPWFLVCATQFRPASLWLACWLAALLVLLRGTPGPGRGLAAGLLLGLATCVSLKTALLVGALAGAGALLLRAMPAEAGTAAPARRRLAACAAALAGGLLVPPLLVVALFARLGALPDLVYGTVLHNAVPGLAGRWPWALGLVSLAVLASLALPLARRLDAVGRRRGLDGRFTFLVLHAALYGALLAVFPLIELQTLLPLYILAAMVIAGLAGRSRAAAPPPRRSLPRLAAGAWALEAALFLALTSPFSDATRPAGRFLADVLRLTGPAEYVLDGKGESIFRRRPFYFALERVTSVRLARGLIVDDIAERCVATRTYVAAADVRHFPPRARDFLRGNYVRVGRLRVAGKLLHPEGDGCTMRFALPIPGRYALVSPGGPTLGWLDGTRYDGPRFLAAGPHDFVAEAEGGPWAVVWARAVERGYSPFAAEVP